MFPVSIRLLYVIYVYIYFKEPSDAPPFLLETRTLEEGD